MTFDEMYSRVLDILPEATCEEDNYGQIIIYTNMKEVGVNMPLQEMEEEDFDD